MRLKGRVLRNTKASCHLPSAGSDPNHGGALFDFFERIELTFAGTGTARLDFFPAFRAVEVRIPERPGPALARSDRIDGASAGLAVEKRAVAVGKLFESRPTTFEPSVFEFHLANRFAQEPGDLFEFLLINPDVSRCARAAVAALRAGKLQAILVPGRLLAHDFENTKPK